ncbi:MAG TPA: hypothetical protein VNE63_05090, partial [Candidatus Acidoferrales bacterium]|nr:hypothetical protein [Candidatus Acidoferrales bacterium]
GSAIWNRALAGRTTFFFAKQMFGADGYTSGGQFFMWHYFSDTVYQNSVSVFGSTNIIPRQSKVAHDVISNILAINALERAWHAHFSQVKVQPENRPIEASTMP